MDRLFFLAACLSSLFAVALGAFGAHTLRDRLAPEMLAVFETGVRYHFYHALALLAVAYAADRWPGSAATAAGWLFLAGTVLFSGSLYLLSLTETRWLGAITPLGGVAFLAGWAPWSRCLGAGPPAGGDDPRPERSHWSRTPPKQARLRPPWAGVTPS